MSDDGTLGYHTGTARSCVVSLRPAHTSANNSLTKLPLNYPNLYVPCLSCWGPD